MNPFINPAAAEKCIECDRELFSPIAEGICNRCLLKLIFSPGEVIQHFRAARIINKFIGKLSPELPLEQLLKELADMFRYYYNFQRMTIFAFESDKNVLRGFCDSEVPREYLFTLIIPTDNEPATNYASRDVALRAFKTGDTIVVNDRSADTGYQNYLKELKEGIKPSKVFSKSFICIPLKTKFSTVGVLALYRMESRHYHPISKQENKILTIIAYQVASIIDAFFPKFYDKMYAITDFLTGLYNHQYLQERLREELMFAEKKTRPLSLIMADIDHFKKFNDNYGHMEGDKVLRIVSDAIKNSVRREDIVCRYGGEEISVILPYTSIQQAKMIGERIRANVEKCRDQKITVSIGMACYPENVKRPDREELIRIADENLYKAKEAGRNCIFPAG